jgi:exopolyphosphatase / guanosine-5'-triphosphate,3'-diphosphate pyrophosphatase
LKFAAIDIGSNAVRLLITNVFEGQERTLFKKASLVRVPVRLGADSFTDGVISANKSKKLIETMRAFKHLINVHEVVSYRACATSAMREATNGKLLVKEIFENTGMKIEIITGKEEAEILFANHFEKTMDERGNYLYIDVGGGSTELTLFSDQKVIASKSFKLGTIRILNNRVKDSLWKSAKKWLKDHTKGLQEITAIGSGGNINKIYRMSEQTGRTPMPVSILTEIRALLNGMTYEDRIFKLGLNDDRADVIIPACDIFLSICNWAKISHISVPEFGVSRLLYDQHLGSLECG